MSRLTDRLAVRDEDPDSFDGFAAQCRCILVGFSLWPFVSGSLLFAVLLGSTVDTYYVSLQRFLWEMLKMFRFQRYAWFDFHLGDDFLELFVFSAMLGSTVAPGDDFVDFLYSAQCLVRHLIHGAASLRGHFTSAALGQGFCPDPGVHHSGGAAVAVFLQGHQHPCRCAETASHGLTSQRP